MSNPFNVLRKHWKKFTFLAVAGPYGVYRLHKYCLDRELMIYHCIKAQEFGDQKLSTLGQPRHVTVILNPVAGKRKAKKHYSKFVEPLLHLAGIKVSLIETESPGQASDLMKIMSDCDCVAIVGGDGTVNEVFNGLLSRPDAATAARSLPVAIIPAGKKNTIAEHVHKNLLHRNWKEFLVTSTMSLVQGKCYRFDVMNIKQMENINENQPKFALRGLKHGVYQNISTAIPLFQTEPIYRLWYKLKRMIMPDKYPKPLINRIEVTEPCTGCVRCYENHRLNDQAKNGKQGSTSKRWWTNLIPMSGRSTQTDEERTEMLLAKRDNPSCNIWKDLELENITNIEALTVADQTIKLNIHRNDDYVPSEELKVQNVRLHTSVNALAERPDEEQGQSNMEDTKGPSKDESAHKNKKEEKGPKYIVDGEPTDCSSVELSALRRSVILFTGPLDI